MKNFQHIQGRALFEGNAQDQHESTFFDVPVSHFPLLFVTSLLLHCCDGFRNEFYLVHTSILAPILAHILELSGSNIAFVGDPKFARFRLSFLIVFGPKMAPKSYTKTVHGNHFVAPCFNNAFLTLRASRRPYFPPPLLAPAVGNSNTNTIRRAPLGKGPLGGGPSGPHSKGNLKGNPKGNPKRSSQRNPKRESQTGAQKRPKGIPESTPAGSVSCEILEKNCVFHKLSTNFVRNPREKQRFS